jgi:hypothetical protein
MPREGLFVGIERVGAFLFALNNPVNHHYVSQKLYIPESDARAIADWINAQLGFDHPQQGHYDRDMLNDIDYIVYSGERPMLPLIPTIIDKEYHEQSKTDGQGIEGCSVSDRSPSI